MRKQVWIHCPNKCFEAVKISEEITAPHPYLSHWICTECGSTCELEMVDLEKQDVPDRSCDNCISKGCKERKIGIGCHNWIHEDAAEKQEVPEEHKLSKEGSKILGMVIDLQTRVETLESKPDTVKQEEIDCDICVRKDCFTMNATECEDYKPPNSESEATAMDFSEALKALKMGNKVKRVGWSDMFVQMVAGASSTADGTDRYLVSSFFVIVRHQGNTVEAWIPSTKGLLATDWMLHIE